ncbi:hypothetical protein GNZ12_07940 [Paraburkholderia sp. 1N]|uniref:Uncharacterized protein n=1 Tax=Paraburkholderia solitsugae TaxID=2675748 RepID=A0ABX2BN52_9BURK|nr:hypothetical protein [Paraburkholderia solitsugae]NPT41248.1 hypothetical protein [Paraburkholderia solitsugae]
MKTIAQRRNEIYDYFHASSACQAFFYASGSEDDYAAYYTSMYLLQDSTECLLAHRVRGFPLDEPLQAYLEFWGVLQAVIIQQDAIAELSRVVLKQAFTAKHLTAWQVLRDLRNECAGHPAKKDRPRPTVVRSFMGRGFGDYRSIKYERWEKGSGRTYPTVALGQLIDDYSIEAGSQLASVLNAMRTRWP